MSVKAEPILQAVLPAPCAGRGSEVMLRAPGTDARCAAGQMNVAALKAFLSKGSRTYKIT